MVGQNNPSESKIDRPSSSSNNDEVQDEDTASIASSTSTDETLDNGLAISDVIEKCNSSIGGICVTNSNDVHFGNKTFYQGPVTIKQFLYHNNNLKPADSESVINDSDSVFQICASSDGILVPVPNCIHNVDPRCVSVSDNGGNKQGPYVENKLNNNVEVERSKSQKGAGWLKNLPKKHVIVVISLSIVLVTSLIISTTILLTRNAITVTNDIIPYPSDGLEQEETDVGRSKDNGSYTLPGKLKIIARGEWVAQPPTNPLRSLRTPVPYVIIMHTATETCTDEPTCIFHVRHIQMFHIESRKWSDIGYNYLVGGDGFAYEGRGWKSEGAHTYGYNVKSIGIALIGTFTNVLPLPRQITATKQLIAKGVELGYIAKDYKLFAARQLQSTESPGKLFFEELKSWSHWAAAP